MTKAAIDGRTAILLFNDLRDKNASQRQLALSQLEAWLKGDKDMAIKTIHALMQTLTEVDEVLRLLERGDYLEAVAYLEKTTRSMRAKQLNGNGGR